MASCTHGAYIFSVLQHVLFFIQEITMTSLSPIYFTESWTQSANSLGIGTDKSELQLPETDKTKQKEECIKLPSPEKSAAIFLGRVKLCQLEEKD